MKKTMTLAKTLRTLALSTALLATSAAGAIAYPSDSAQAAVSSLAQGARGADVSGLQSNLQTLGFFTYPNITGYFGPITAQAVSKFQRAYSLPVTGAADGITRTAVSRAVLKNRLIADTYSYTGVPYKWGGTTTSGFDCSGFIHFMFTKFGVYMPRTTADELFKSGFTVGRSSLRPGDLVFFSINRDGSVSHVGFYVGGGKFISPTRSAGVITQSLDVSYWGSRYIGAKRVY